MILRRHGHAHSVDQLARNLFEIFQHPRLEFRADSRSALRIRINNPHQLRAFDLAPHPHVVPAEFSGSHHSHADWNRAHALLFSADSRATKSRSAAKASIAIAASSAARINSSRSNSNVCPASIAKAVAFDRLITSIVFRPTTGTSNRISCSGLLTFTT